MVEKANPQNRPLGLLNRRALLLATAASPLAACGGERFFTLSWVEEVALHDSSVIAASLKFTYERLEAPLFGDPYRTAILRDTLLSFDSGRGVVTQLFQRQRPMLLDRNDDGTWFVVLQGRGYSSSLHTTPDWGQDQNGNGQRMARQEGSRFVLAHLSKLPGWVKGGNLLMDYAPVAELMKLNGKKITLMDKEAYFNKYPLQPVEREIRRPQASA